MQQAYADMQNVERGSAKSNKLQKCLISYKTCACHQTQFHGRSQEFRILVTDPESTFVSRLGVVHVRTTSGASSLWLYFRTLYVRCSRGQLTMFKRIDGNKTYKRNHLCTIRNLYAWIHLRSEQNSRIVTKGKLGTYLLWNLISALNKNTSYFCFNRSIK